jgi:hypothetical protein
MRYAALRERKVRKFLFHCLKSVFGPMVDKLRALLELGTDSYT